MIEFFLQLHPFIQALVLIILAIPIILVGIAGGYVIVAAIVVTGGTVFSVAFLAVVNAIDWISEKLKQVKLRKDYKRYIKEQEDETKKMSD